VRPFPVWVLRSFRIYFSSPLLLFLGFAKKLVVLHMRNLSSARFLFRGGSQPTARGRQRCFLSFFLASPFPPLSVSSLLLSPPFEYARCPGPPAPAGPALPNQASKTPPQPSLTDSPFLPCVSDALCHDRGARTNRYHTMCRTDSPCLAVEHGVAVFPARGFTLPEETPFLTHPR